MEKRPRFYTPLKVRYAETDMQGHVFFGNYLTYFDVGVTEYVNALGYGVQQFLADGADFYYIESLCQYRSRAFFDEVLRVYVTVGHLGRTSFRFDLQVHEEKSDRLVARGHIVAVSVATDDQQPTPIPEGFRKAVAAYEGDGGTRG